MHKRTRWLIDMLWVGIAVSLGGCSGTEISAGQRVLPMQEHLTYQSARFQYDAKGAVLSSAPASKPLEAEISANSISTYIDGLGGGNIPLRADGTIDAQAQDRFVVGSDVFEYLPPAGQALRTSDDSAYHTAVPEGIIRASGEAFALHVFETVTSKPLTWWRTDAGIVLRVEAEGARVDAGLRGDEILTKEEGLDHRGIADLLQVPGEGWRLIRAFRIDDLQDATMHKLSATQVRALPLDKLRQYQRATGVFCLTSSDKVSKASLAAILADTHGYYEFNACAGGR